MDYWLEVQKLENVWMSFVDPVQIVDDAQSHWCAVGNEE